jgi:lysophospholipase L1-like esterase
MITRSVVSSVVRKFVLRSGAAPILSGAVPIPDPTTVNFTSAQFAPGFSGSISTTKNAARIYARGDVTLWSGFITGTEAKLTNPSDFGDNDGSMQVAINGSAFTSAARTGSVYTLFTGLPHAKRFVEVRWVIQMGEAPYIASSGNVLQVTGQPPSLETMGSQVTNGSNSDTGFYSGALIANIANYAPPLQAPSGTTYGSNVGSVKMKGAFSKLVVTVGGPRKVGVSKNGGAPSFYSIADESGGPIRAIVVPCDGSTSTYNVWDSGNYYNTGGHFAVSGDSALLNIGTTKQFHIFGDSIVAGAGPGATAVDSEMMSVASALGGVGTTIGVAGQTIVGCKTMLDNALPLLTVSANDVAVLSIGGNSASGGIDATKKADYLSCINKLQAKGYGKILCRGILPTPDGSDTRAIYNVELQSVVTTLADPNVMWIDTSAWIGYDTQDNTHPTIAGYVTLASYALPAYTSLLGL